MNDVKCPIHVWIEDGPRMDRGWIGDGSRLDRGWIEDGSRMDRGWIEVGSRMDRGWMVLLVGGLTSWLAEQRPTPLNEKKIA